MKEKVNVIKIVSAVITSAIVCLAAAVIIIGGMNYTVCFKDIHLKTDSYVSQEERDKWYLILVNKTHYLPEGYNVDIVTLSNGERVDSRIYEPLQKMFDDMRKEGIYPVVASGYRTQEEQQGIMDEKIDEYLSQGYSESEAKKKAEEWVAIPGTSEHQLGIAVDINADGINSYGDEVYEWLLANSYKYGFIKRYPEDKTNITGIINEPWHYRYVGEKAAKEMVKNNLCLEEYLGELG